VSDPLGAAVTDTSWCSEVLMFGLPGSLTADLLGRRLQAIAASGYDFFVVQCGKTRPPEAEHVDSNIGSKV
jgi:hypothetical protein